MYLRRSLLFRWQWILLGLASASLAVLVRSTFSLMLVSAVLATVLVALWLRSGVRPRSIRASIGPNLMLVTSLLVVLLIPWTVLRLRDAVWKIEPAVHIETHGTSHNLIIGLGVVENELGVTWNNPEIVGTTRDSDIAVDNFGIVTLKLLAVFCTVYPIVKLWGSVIT